MDKPTITVLDAVHSKANKSARPLIAPLLSYKESVWVREWSGRRKQKIVEKSMVDRNGYLLTGLLPYIVKREKVAIDLKGFERTAIERLPRLPGITFREDQRAALGAVRRRQRGIILFPTGTGKTVIAGGIVSMFPTRRILLLCHTRDLLTQTFKELKLWFGKDRIVGIGGSFNNGIDKLKSRKSPIAIATIQSYIKLHKAVGADFWDITIVDEVHHVNDLQSQYGQVMQMNLSPRRYGLTATRPIQRKQQLVNEGIFGPVIASLTVQQGIKKGIIARPIVNLVPVPYEISLNKDCHSYSDYYDHCIVRNKERNRLVAAQVNPSEITLIIIERTEHGLLLQKELSSKQLVVPFVRGSSSSSERNTTKQLLKSGQIKLVICSRVWKEGINIPSLNHIINACGMKDEKGVLQTAGRGLRATINKTTIKLTDFLDPYRYLAEHSVQRVAVYIKNGWM